MSWLRLALLGAAVLIATLLAAAVAPSRAAAEWKVIGPEAYGWYDEAGKYTGRWMTENAFGRMAERMAKGVQSLGTGSGSGYTSQASNGVAIADKLKTIATGAGIAGTVRSLKGDTLGLMSRLKSYGLLKSLGTLALAGTSFEVGWKIGSEIADLFFDEPDSEWGGPESGFANLIAYEVAPVEAGEKLETVFTPGVANPTGAMAPGPGFVVGYKFAAGGGVLYSVLSPASAVPNAEGKCAGASGQTLWETPEGATHIETGSATVGEPSCRTGVMFYPETVEHLPGEEFTPPATTKETAGQTPQNAGDATKTAEACLRSATLCGYLPPWWWNHDPEAQEDTQVDGSVEEGLEPADPLKVRVPKPGAHESYQAYGERLEKLELDPDPVALGESAIDPSRGPEEVVSTSPKPNTQVQPESTVRVRYNPVTAPEPGSGFGTSGPGCEATVGSVSLGPLNQPVSDHFPFGIVAFFVGWIGEWTGEYPPPEFDLTMVPEGTFGSDGLVIHVDLSKVEALVEPARIAFIFLSFVGLLWFLGTAAMKLQGDSS